MPKIQTLLSGLILASNCYSQYHPVEHRKVSGTEVAVLKAGSYASSGTTYVLAHDITSVSSTLFLGKDVTLDLNGYTIMYANAKYEHIPNSGFEDGLKGWDLSKAPGARLENTRDIHVFLGEKLLSMKAGDELSSPYINLPVADRSYFAMCGITGRYYHEMKKYPDDEMKVSVYVEDEKGNNVRCMTKYGDGTRLSCPVEKKSPRLGGGFVYAHLTRLPAGKYRVRIKADTDCLVDEIDIRPAMDAGISIIENTTPLAHYDHVIMESYPPVFPAFYDYTEDFGSGKALSSLPRVKGSGTITIRNGTIESGFAGILSWGVQSSAPNVKIILENVNVKTKGISSGAADMLWADIRNCRFDSDMPFLIQRHVFVCSVVIRGNNASEVKNSEFIGGQGCLSIKGKYSLVHDNLFVNAQTVTNHYSIMGTGDSSKIYNNKFEPKQGSGIYVSRYTEVFNNIFNIETSPPTCEYGREEYSTAGIRLGDYNAKPGSPKASVGNRIHGNSINITAKNYPEPAEFIPMAWGIYYSASGGENYVYDNDIRINKVDTASKVLTAAFYICGGPKYFGGQFYNNRITTNVPAAWIASFYGGASNSNLYNNTIIPLNGAKFKTFRIGSMGCDDCVAKNITFRSNETEGQKFALQVTDQDHSYSVFWTLKSKVVDAKGSAVKNAGVIVLDKSGAIALNAKTDDYGRLTAELPEYSVDGKNRKDFSPYTIVVADSRKEVVLDADKEIAISPEGKARGETGKSRTFIINASIADLKEFRSLVEMASRLKDYGRVQINISTLADKSFYEIPAGGNPWNEYASNNPALYKFFPDPKIAPFVPAEFVMKNRRLLLEKAKILRENGMEAAFFANEPAFLPPAFFEAYPQLRGPRVDHPRRSKTPCFSPCMSVKEMQEIYAGMMAELLRNAPEIKTYFFKTNDAGSGNCWSDWLYTGPNGPNSCKGKTTGQRIEELFSSMKAGAEKAGSNLDIYLSHPQGSSNFSDEERADIQNRLPENCYFSSTPGHEMVSFGSDFAFLYPVKGVCDVLSSLNDLDRIDNQKQQTVFISFNAFYDRGNESPAVENILFGLLKDHFSGTMENRTALQKLHEFSTFLAGDVYADTLQSAFMDLTEAFEFKNSKFGNLYGIYWDVSSRMINRPLVAAPQRLSHEEEEYFLPYIFNVSREEARMDYLDIHGGRWTTSPEAIKIYVQKIQKVSEKLESIDPQTLKNDFIPKMALALRVHASLVRSCANFTEAQQIRDNNVVRLNGPIHRPDKEGTWTGDADLLKFNAVMRDELDNTAGLTQILQNGGISVLCRAEDNAHEDCFLLNHDIIGQLKKKYKIMIDHWRDIEDYMTTPFK